jgi:Zn-dependent protease with chaperone function
MRRQIMGRRMTKLPRRFAPFVYGIIQSGITTAIASGIATAQALGFNTLAVGAWIVAWLAAWAVMLPVVILIAPLIQKAVLSVTEPPY